MRHIPRWLIEKTATEHDVDARRFSATSHFVMLILGPLTHASCLTEICDDASLTAGRLALVRHSTPGKRNTFSHANRTRPAEVAEKVYWKTVEHRHGTSPGFVPLADRAYVDFGFLHGLTARDVFWVLRQKANMLCEVVGRGEVSGYVLADETVRLTAANTSAKYPETFRLVRAIVEVNGERREMTFLTNNTKWAARTVCELYRARWSVEVFFKGLKQTLQLSDFIGTKENAVKWQIWTGLLTHLLLHDLKFLSGWGKAFSRLAGIVRAAVWMNLDIVETLRLYGTESPPHRPRLHCVQPFLAGF